MAVRGRRVVNIAVRRERIINRAAGDGITAAWEESVINGGREHIMSPAREVNTAAQGRCIISKRH
ncbi:hypothetical protein HispidOSU_005406 [Sigmodon hispidus]